GGSGHEPLAGAEEGVCMTATDATQRAVKCLARALDPACPQAEAETSGAMRARVLRSGAVTLPMFLKALPSPATIKTIPDPPDDEPVECGWECWFGKHKGR